MPTIIERVKNLFTTYDDEDYVSDLILDDESALIYENEEVQEDYQDMKKSNYEMQTFFEPVRNEKITRNRVEDRNMSNYDNEPRLVNFKDMNTNRVVMFSPSSLEDGQAVANQLKAGRICIVNFENTDGRLAQRVIDFLTGAAHSLGGAVSPISNLIFMVTPLNISISDGFDEDRSVYNEDRDYTSLRNLVSGL